MASQKLLGADATNTRAGSVSSGLHPAWFVAEYRSQHLVQFFPGFPTGAPCPGLLVYSLLTKCALWSQLVRGRKPTAKQESHWKPKMPPWLVGYTVRHYPTHSFISPFTNIYCLSTSCSCNARVFRSGRFIQPWKGEPMVVRVFRIRDRAFSLWWRGEGQPEGWVSIETPLQLGYPKERPEECDGASGLVKQLKNRIKDALSTGLRGRLRIGIHHSKPHLNPASETIPRTLRNSGWPPCCGAGSLGQQGNHQRLQQQEHSNH